MKNEKQKEDKREKKEMSRWPSWGGWSGCAKYKFVFGMIVREDKAWVRIWMAV